MIQPKPTSYNLDDPGQMTMGQLTSPLPSSYNLDAPTTTKPKLPPPTAITQPAPQLPVPQLPPPGDLTMSGGGNGLTDVSQFTPGQNLIGSQITPGATDRMALAKDYFNQFQEATNPAYENTIRTATQRAAANGRLHSGMLTTDYGNLAEGRARDLDLLQRGLLTDATQASIQDAANARGELRTERDYQNGLSQEAINNAIQQYLLQMNLGNTQLQAGESGNPSAILLGASGQKQASGTAASDAGAQALAQWAYLNGYGVT